MAKHPQETRNEPASPSEASRTAERPYETPSLLRREKLSQLVALSKSSGISTDNVQSDRRLKDDIRLVGRTFDGLNVYTFRYKNDPVVRMGVMAQEVLPVHPEAVSERDGYLAVDYSRIGSAPLGGSRPGEAPRRYSKPALVARQRLAQVSAALVKSSGISTDGQGSDIRLKDDIRLVGRTFDGLNIYTFRYKRDPLVRMGVMAQEVLAVHPEAVGEIDGYLAVDYGQIGNALSR